MTWLSKREAAAYLKVSPRWFNAHPEIRRFGAGRVVRIIKEDLDSWLLNREQRQPMTDRPARRGRLLAPIAPSMSLRQAIGLSVG